jgi:hypothetical protein
LKPIAVSHEEATFSLDEWRSEVRNFCYEIRNELSLLMRSNGAPSDSNDGLGDGPASDSDTIVSAEKRLRDIRQRLGRLAMSGVKDHDDSPDARRDEQR